VTPRVLVDADVLGRQRTGDESYVTNLLRELGTDGHGVDVEAVTRHPALVPDGVTAISLGARNQMARMAWSLPKVLRRRSPDVAHFQYVVPPLYRGAAVITVHDLSFERNPEFMSTKDRVVFQRLVPWSARRAARVLTVSDWSRRDILERYGLEDEKVVVTPNGVDAAFRPDGPVPDVSPYLLFVGAIQPRKDPLTAVEALALLDADLRLVMAGPHKLGVDLVRERVESLGLSSRVELRGHVTQEELAALYRGALCLVFPSRYEGFGLPVLEAMASGTPVVCARASALPEVAGDAAVLVEPGDAEALADGVREALRRRDDLVAAGLARAAVFRWSATAARTAAVYREVA
jgi:glycosyltransferase involved in cell wall biosynthesis